MGDILYRLILFISTNKNNDVDYNIAINILKNINIINKMTINQLAEKCYTSPSAISRFTRKLGYESFSEFKEMTLNAIGNYKGRNVLHELKSEFGYNESIKDMLFNKISNDLQTVRDLDETAFEKIVDLIHDTETIGIFGTHLSQAFAQDLEVSFLTKGKYITAFLDVQKQQELVDSFDRNALAIIFSPSGKFVSGNKPIIDRIKSTGCKVIFISQRDHHDFFDRVDAYLKLEGSTDPSASNISIRYSSLYILDYIFIKYLEKYINT